MAYSELEIFNTEATIYETKIFDGEDLINELPLLPQNRKTEILISAKNLNVKIFIYFLGN